MRVFIHMLRDAEGITNRLQQDGWEIVIEDEEVLSACHASVISEEDARLRLQDLGLLTSGRLRIEFPAGTHLATGEPCRN